MLMPGSPTLAHQKTRLSDAERNASLSVLKKEKASQTPPSQGRFLSSPPPESLPDCICIHVKADKALEHEEPPPQRSGFVIPVATYGPVTLTA
jgi:hypothetical protein